jgi:hypothetical protein
MTTQYLIYTAFPSHSPGRKELTLLFIIVLTFNPSRSIFVYIEWLITPTTKGYKMSRQTTKRLLKKHSARINYLEEAFTPPTPCSKTQILAYASRVLSMPHVIKRGSGSLITRLQRLIAAPGGQWKLIREISSALQCGSDTVLSDYKSKRGLAILRRMASLYSEGTTFGYSNL